MTISLERIAFVLPPDFPELEADAAVDGHRHMARLAAEFALDRSIFHAVYMCRVNGRLAGVGAITDEPALAPQTDSSAASIRGGEGSLDDLDWRSPSFGLRI